MSCSVAVQVPLVTKIPLSPLDPISFFQCVYLDGYNGYGFQFPVTPAQRPGENSGKPNSPGQKQQGH